MSAFIQVTTHGSSLPIWTVWFSSFVIYHLGSRKEYCILGVLTDSPRRKYVNMATWSAPEKSLVLGLTVPPGVAAAGLTSQMTFPGALSQYFDHCSTFPKHAQLGSIRGVSKVTSI